jgi:hypothetical protein
VMEVRELERRHDEPTRCRAVPGGRETDTAGVGQDIAPDQESTPFVAFMYMFLRQPPHSPVALAQYNSASPIPARRVHQQSGACRVESAPLRSFGLHFDASGRSVGARTVDLLVPRPGHVPRMPRSARQQSERKQVMRSAAALYYSISMHGVSVFLSCYIYLAGLLLAPSLTTLLPHRP